MKDDWFGHTKPRILYVDDEPENLQSFKSLFRRDYDIVVADSAFKAIEILRRENIQVLVTDQRMPGMSGSELLEQVADEFPEVLRFMLTGFSDFDPLVDAINKGRVQGYFSKPLNPDEINRRIRKGLEPLYLKAKTRLLESQVLQLQKIQSIGTLAGGIAHDFNNILTPIIGYVEMMLNDVAPDSRMGKNLASVLQAAHRAKELVRQILIFSRQNEPELKPLQAASIVKESLQLLRASLPATIELHETIAENTRMVMADPTQLQQVVVNLCTNAYHAMQQQGGTIEVVLEEVERIPEYGMRLSPQTPGPYIKLTVRDTGIGMPEEVLERIFDPYFTTKPVGEGTGLGLSVVYGIIMNYKGGISVRSKPGKGTDFSVFLPVVQKLELEKSDTLAAIQGGSERILIADDEKEITEMMKQMLERLGYRVTTFTDGDEALSYFRAHPSDFDLVLANMTMPHITGIQLARNIAQIRPDIKILIVTGFSASIEKEREEVPAIRGVLMKPIIMRELAAKTREVLDIGK